MQKFDIEKLTDTQLAALKATRATFKSIDGFRSTTFDVLIRHGLVEGKNHITTQKNTYHRTYRLTMLGIRTLNDMRYVKKAH